MTNINLNMKAVVQSAVREIGPTKTDAFFFNPANKHLVADINNSELIKSDYQAVQYIIKSFEPVDKATFMPSKKPSSGGGQSSAKPKKPVSGGPSDNSGGGFANRVHERVKQMLNGRPDMHFAMYGKPTDPSTNNFDKIFAKYRNSGKDEYDIAVAMIKDVERLYNSLDYRHIDGTTRRERQARDNRQRKPGR